MAKFKEPKEPFDFKELNKSKTKSEKGHRNRKYEPDSRHNGPKKPGAGRTKPIKMDDPTTETVTPSALTFLLNEYSLSSIRDVQIGKELEVAAEPGALATKISGIIEPIVNKLNTVMDTAYPGDQSLNGNNLKRIANDVSQSQMSQLFDCGSMRMRLNYLYSAMRAADDRSAYNEALAQTVTEALSSGSVSQSTELPFFKYTVDITKYSEGDDIPAELRVPAWGSGTTLMWALMYYQTFLQNLLHVTDAYVRILSLEDELKDLGVRREAAWLVEYFNELRKTTTAGHFNKCIVSITGEFVDLDWNEQVNVILQTPSRKSKSRRNPLLVVNATHKMPQMSVWSAGVQIFSNKDFYVTFVDRLGTTHTNAEIDELVASIQDCLDPTTILSLARNNSTPGATETAKKVSVALYNMLTVLGQLVSKFKDAMTEVRAFIEEMKKTGRTAWKQGLDRTVSNGFPPVSVKYVALIHHLFQVVGATAAEMRYGEITDRWGFMTIWSEFSGIPQFDRTNGGAFLSMSARSMKKSTGETDTFSSKWIIPRLFNQEDIAAEDLYFVNKKGHTVGLGRQVYSNSQIAEDHALCRLNALSSSTVTLRVPTLTADGIPGVVDTAEKIKVASAMEHLLLNIFGYGKVYTSTTAYDTICSSDIVCLVDAELPDVTNAMQSLIRAFAPFIVMSPSLKRSVGFLRLPSVKDRAKDKQ